MGSTGSAGAGAATLAERAEGGGKFLPIPSNFMALAKDGDARARSRAHQLMQDLQLMVCSKENGIRGNAARARTMVLLKEVQVSRGLRPKELR